MRYRSCVLLLLVSLVWPAQALSLPARTTTQDACASAHCLLLPLVQRSLDGVRIGRVQTDCAGPLCSGVVFHGYIETLGHAPVYNTLLELTFDFEGTLSTRIITPSLTATFPGERNPFITSYKDQSLSTNPIKVISASLTSNANWVPLTVVSKQITSTSSYTFNISGEIRNDFPQTVSALEGVVIFESGAVARTDFDATTLAPGAMTTYTSFFYSNCSIFGCASASEDQMVWVHGVMSP
jgi:hypothetical protein